jgi:hypothetical protein
MCQFLITHLATILGILIILIGTLLVAYYEVFKRFKGEQFQRTPTVYGSSPPPEKTKEFIDWERRRSKVMRTGIFFLIIGSLLQIVIILI